MNENSAAGAGEWYYDTRTHSTCKEPGPDRLGPYPTRDEAASAMQTVTDRNDEWRQDSRWNDDGTDA
ncbi:hypothetical protein ACWC98_37325 [Streptomyces goshikiensis]|uniref:hypothetical protein n=1 Tax=Streptomyces goshikiensis TaxID=1942 RepID=UPI00369458B5